MPQVRRLNVRVVRHLRQLQPEPRVVKPLPKQPKNKRHFVIPKKHLLQVVQLDALPDVYRLVVPVRKKADKVRQHPQHIRKRVV